MSFWFQEVHIKLHAATEGFSLTSLMSVSDHVCCEAFRPVELALAGWPSSRTVTLSAAASATPRRVTSGPRQVGEDAQETLPFSYMSSRSANVSP